MSQDQQRELPESIDLAKTTGGSPPSEPTKLNQLRQNYRAEPRVLFPAPTPYRAPTGLLPLTPTPELPPFLTLAELRAQADAAPRDWIWEGYLAPELVTVLAGKPKAAGKSTLLFGLLKAMQTKAEFFLDQELRPTPVVYLSEESRSTLLEKQELFRLSDQDLYFYTRQELYPRKPFSVVVDSAVRKAAELGARLLIVDTSTAWSGLQDDQENNTAAVQSIVMDPLMAATNAGLSVLLVHHVRKGNPTTLDAVRGSSAIVGSADIPCLLFHQKGTVQNERKLLSDQSRSRATPDRLRLALDGNRYIRLDKIQHGASEPTRLGAGAPPEPRVIHPSSSDINLRAYKGTPYAPDDQAEAVAEEPKAIYTRADVGQSTYSELVNGKSRKGVRLTKGWTDPELRWFGKVGNRVYRRYQELPPDPKESKKAA